MYRNEPYIVLDYQHSKQARGRALVQVKVKNMITGSIVTDTLRSDEKFQIPDLQHRPMQYLYAEDGMYNFLDQDNYDQVVLSEDQIEDVKPYLKEQAIYDMLYFSEQPIAINPPLFMELEVTNTPPGVKGDTAQGGGNKPATLETGLVLQVPLFVDIGDILKIDTRDAKYIERVKK